MSTRRWSTGTGMFKSYAYDDSGEWVAACADAATASSIARLPQLEAVHEAAAAFEALREADWPERSEDAPARWDAIAAAWQRLRAALAKVTP